MSVLILSILFVLTICRQNFTYNYQDNFVIFPNDVTALTNTFITGVDQYLQQGVIIINTTLTSNSTFNILLFNLLDTGNECYNSYVNNNILPPAVNCIDNLNISVNCLNYTNCPPNTKITIQFYLDPKEQYTQLYLIAQNLGNQNINIQSNYNVILLSSNSWFYWGVALTCLLILLIVILTGIAIYWSLKYKKTKKKFQHYKITGQHTIKNQ